MGRYILILVIGATVAYGISNLALNKNVTRGTENSAKLYMNTRARNISNSTAEMIIAQLSDSTTWRESSPVDLSIFGGTASYTIKDTTLDSQNRIKISINTSYSGVSHSTTAYVSVPPFNPIRATYMTYRDIEGIISDMFIDGRDYDTSGTMNSASGVYGVTTNISFINTDKGEVGGTADGTDYAPAYPEDPAVIEENYDWGGSYPQTPDKALGFPEGTLKAIAKSGAGGSQYVKDCQLLTYPLSGVTYVDSTEGNNGLTIDNKNFSPSNGILVCFNNTTTASVVDKIESENDGDYDFAFRGILITQQLEHFHISMYGTVILLAPGTDNKCGSNGGHIIRYSTDAVNSALNFAATEAGVPPSNPNGTGEERMIVNHWLE